MRYKLTIERLHQKNPEEGAIQGLYKTEYKQHFQKKIRLRKMNSENEYTIYPENQ